MTVTQNEQGRIVLSPGTPVAKVCRKRIQELNDDALFVAPSMNRHGRELVLYLCNYSYHDLSNPEPIDLTKNTLAKVLSRLQVIDRYVRKPLEAYTPSDLNNFLRDFQDGKLKTRGITRRSLSPQSMVDYIREFKRLMQVYRALQLHRDPSFNPRHIEWVSNLKAPRVKNRQYERYPYLRVNQVIQLAGNMVKEEYKVRVLLSINLMGRKCEMSALRYRDIEFREKGAVWIQLPQVKKHSTPKVPVELFTFAKKPLLHYIEHMRFQDDDLLFPSKEGAFSKNLRTVSERLFKQRINPKTLRKLGVCVAEQFNYSRSDVERIGGWQVNSPVLSHYFNRKGVEAKKDADRAIEKEQHSDVYAEFEKVKQDNRVMKSQNAALGEEMSQMKDQLRKLQSLIVRQGLV